MALSDRRGIQPSTGFQDPLDFRQGTGLLRHMVQHMIRNDGIYRGGREGQRLGINDREGQGPIRRTEALAGMDDHPHRGIRHCHGPAYRYPGPILDPEVTRSTAQFHDATLEWQPELIEHPPQPTIRVRAEPLMECNPGMKV